MIRGGRKRITRGDTVREDMSTSCNYPAATSTGCHCAEQWMEDGMTRLDRGKILLFNPSSSSGDGGADFGGLTAIIKPPTQVRISASCRPPEKKRPNDHANPTACDQNLHLMNDARTHYYEAGSALDAERQYGGLSESLMLADDDADDDNEIQGFNSPNYQTGCGAGFSSYSQHLKKRSIEHLPIFTEQPLKRNRTIHLA